MYTNKKVWAGVAFVVIAIIAAAIWYISSKQVPTPLPVSASDHLTSWALPLPQDAASSTPTLTAQIGQFTAMLGGGAYPNETIYVAIANDYILTGNGKAAYDAYEQAIAASSTDSLAYDDLGGLFARLYATSSAERAYAQAVAYDPTQLLFQLSYVDYLAEVAPSSSTTAAAFVSAKTAIGATNPNLLIAEAGWLTQIGSTTAAIADWKAVEAQEPGQAATINATIAQLEK